MSSVDDYCHTCQGDFHGGNTGSNPVGDAKSFPQLTVFPFLKYRHKKGTSRCRQCERTA